MLKNDKDSSVFQTVADYNSPNFTARLTNRVSSTLLEVQPQTKTLAVIKKIFFGVSLHPDQYILLTQEGVSLMSR